MHVVDVNLKWVSHIACLNLSLEVTISRIAK